jgi:two-component system sensor histidine kinase KdpD
VPDVADDQPTEAVRDAPSGDVTSGDVTMRDLVGLVQAQSTQIEILQRTTRALESRLALRTQVEVLLSHELRTPITVIMGVLQTLETTGLQDEPSRALVARGLAQGHYLADMVEDLLNADPERGPTFSQAIVRRVRLGDLTDQACAAVSGSLPASRIRCEIDRDVDVSTAPSRFVAILVNLLENAAKYGGSSMIELRAGLDGRALIIEVADRGIGLIRGDDVEELFEPFSRGAGAADVPGQGVGLFLVRMLARSLGGTATLEARPAGGVLARVTLPQRRAADREHHDLRSEDRAMTASEAVAWDAPTPGVPAVP